MRHKKPKGNRTNYIKLEIITYNTKSHNGIGKTLVRQHYERLKSVQPSRPTPQHVRTPYLSPYARQPLDNIPLQHKKAALPNKAVSKPKHVITPQNMHQQNPTGEFVGVGGSPSHGARRLPKTVVQPGGCFCGLVEDLRWVSGRKTGRTHGVLYMYAGYRLYARRCGGAEGRGHATRFLDQKSVGEMEVQGRVTGGLGEAWL